MKPMEAKTFKLKNGLNIHADILGDGPLLMCLSGYANTNHNFKLLAPHLATRYTLCMIDARGMGKSDPATAEYKMDDLADDALEIAEQMGAKEFSVLGISLGGYPSQLMAMKAPERVKNAVLIATRGPGKKYDIISRVTEEGFSAFMKMDPIQGNYLAISMFVHPNFLKNEPLKMQEIVSLRARENTITLEQSLMQLRAGFKFVDAEDIDMKKITCPTLIISGKEDCFLPNQNAQVLQEEIRNSELVFIPETSHLCFFEKPKEISDEIIKFLNKQKY